MSLKIGFIISLLVFIGGAIGLYYGMDGSVFRSPADTGFFSPEIFSYVIMAISAISGAFILWKSAGRENSYAPVVLGMVIVFVAIAGVVYVSSWVEERDLAEHGIEIKTTIDQTDFEWVSGRREQLYYSYSYQLNLNGSKLSFRRWQRITYHNFTSTHDPKVTHEMLPEHHLLRPGDTLKVLVSTVNPQHQRLLSMP